MISSLFSRVGASLVVAVLMVGCKSAPPAPSMDATAFCTGAATRPAFEKGQTKGARGQVEGYVQIPRSLMCSDTCNFHFTPDAAGKGPNIAASLRLGSGSNQLDGMKKDFKREDLVLRTLDGKKVDLARPVRLSGAHLGKDMSSCVMIVDRVEQ
jgi:hypothetical protein